MKPKRQPRDAFELFRSHFDQLLNPNHELIRLAKQIDWPRFETAFADCYSPDMGAPGKAVRLMVGLLYLKHAFNESDESLVARWVENPYWHFLKKLLRVYAHAARMPDTSDGVGEVPQPRRCHR